MGWPARGGFTSGTATLFRRCRYRKAVGHRLLFSQINIAVQHVRMINLAGPVPSQLASCIARHFATPRVTAIDFVNVVDVVPEDGRERAVALDLRSVIPSTQWPHACRAESSG